MLFFRNIIRAVSIVFIKFEYIVFGISIFGTILTMLLFTSEFIFFEPYITGHLPQDGELDFVLIIIISVLSGLVVPVGVASIRNTRTMRRGFAGSVTGTSIGVVAGVCSCGPLGFALIGSFGAAGLATASFLSTYDLPLRLASIAALLVSLHITSSAFTQECKLS